MMVTFKFDPIESEAIGDSSILEVFLVIIIFETNTD